MRSMTGFGSAEKYSEELQYGFKVELASINKKQFDLKISMGRELARYETELRTFIAGRVTRGSLTLRIETVVHADSGVQKVDFTKAEALLAAAREFQKKHDLPGEITISDILAIPEAAVVQAADLSGEECLNFLESTVAEAVDELIRMRTREGENLKRDILGRIGVMETLVDEIRPLAAQLPAIQKERLFKRLKEFDLSIEDTDERILREAVTEEITRLRSHFTNFRKLANEPENPVGRSLDFMVQEIFRECNTLGNKAGSTEISPRVVMLKTELEKIREQVQNIE